MWESGCEKKSRFLSRFIWINAPLSCAPGKLPSRSLFDRAVVEEIGAKGAMDLSGVAPKESVELSGVQFDEVIIQIDHFASCGAAKFLQLGVIPQGCQGYYALLLLLPLAISSYSTSVIAVGLLNAVLLNGQ